MEKIKVECLEKIKYGGGESRMRPGVAVDYLYVTVTLSDGKEVEYYIETPEISTMDESYDALVDDIYLQMSEDGLEIDKSEFYRRRRLMQFQGIKTIMQSHYDVPGREKQPIELMRLGLTDAEFDGYCIGNVMKYLLRHKHKGGTEDLYKAREYIDFLIRSHCRLPILDNEE